jgi:hypothetical protein
VAEAMVMLMSASRHMSEAAGSAPPEEREQSIRLAADVKGALTAAQAMWSRVRPKPP